MSGWRPGVKFVVGWWVREMLVDLPVVTLVEGGEEKGRRGGTRPLVDPGMNLSLEGCFLTKAYEYLEKLLMSLLPSTGRQIKYVQRGISGCICMYMYMYVCRFIAFLVSFSGCPVHKCLSVTTRAFSWF